MGREVYALILILIMAVMTLLTRAIPFLIFSGKCKTPKYILYLGKVLPYATMAMLIVYCLKDAEVLKGTHGIPEFISIALVVGLHLWKKNVLISIASGTCCYMLLLQFVF